MSRSLFDLGDPLPPVLHSGVTVESRSASRDAGEQNRRDGTAGIQRSRMLAEYRHYGSMGVTDAEMSARLNILRHVVPARRAELKHAYTFRADGRREGSTVWILEE